MEGSILPDMRASEASIGPLVQTCAVHLQDLDRVPVSTTGNSITHCGGERSAGGSIRGGRRRGRSDEKNSLCHLAVSTLPARGGLKGKIKGSVTPANRAGRGRNGGADPARFAMATHSDCRGTSRVKRQHGINRKTS